MKCSALSLLFVCLCASVLNAQWTPASPLDNGSVNAMVSDGTYLYAATYDGIYRSISPAGGWELVANGDESRYYQNVFVIDGDIYAGAEGRAQAHRLEAGSDTWSLVSNNPDAYFRHITKVGDTFFATGYASSGLWSSTDGETWESVSFENWPYGAQVFSVNNRLFARQLYGPLYVSDDLQGFSLALEGSISLLTVTGNTLFARTAASLAVSTDAGETWTDYTNHPAFEPTGSALAGAIAFDGKWVVGSFSPYLGMLVSDDEGASWDFFEMTDDFSMPIEDFVVHNGVLYGDSPYGTVSRIDFDGNTPSFTDQSTGLRTSGAPNVVVSGDKLFTHRFARSFYTINSDLTTSPGFEEWAGVDLPGNSVFSIIKNFRNGAFVAFQWGDAAIYLRRHTDNAFANITGNLAEVLGPNWFVYSALMAGDVICMHMGSGNFVTSSDGGTTWVDRGVVPYSLREEILYHNGSIIAFSGLGPYAVYRSNDLGETWEEIADLGWLNIQNVATNGNRIVAQSTQERAISDDGGVTWQLLNNEGLFFTMHHVKNTTGTLVVNTYSAESPLMVSHDMGETFEPLEADGLPEHMPFNLINLEDSNERLYLQYENGLFFSAPRAALGIETSVAEVHPVENMRVFPNPASDRLAFEVLEERTLVRMVDLRGAVVFESVLPSGSNAVDLSQLSDGWYVLHLVGLQSNTVRRAPFLIRR
jgi:photosystem II stability/assembly factor-like uncharacterized protein